MKEGDPEMYGLLKQEFELQRQTIDMAVQHRRAPESQRPVVKKELEELVDRHFDIRQKRRQLELKRLEEELKRLREAMQRRNDVRKALVKKRVSELLGEENVDF